MHPYDQQYNAVSICYIIQSIILHCILQYRMNKISPIASAWLLCDNHQVLHRILCLSRSQISSICTSELSVTASYMDSVQFLTTSPSTPQYQASQQAKQASKKQASKPASEQTNKQESIQSIQANSSQAISQNDSCALCLIMQASRQQHINSTSCAQLMQYANGFSVYFACVVRIDIEHFHIFQISTFDTRYSRTSLT